MSIPQHIMEKRTRKVLTNEGHPCPKDTRQGCQGCSTAPGSRCKRWGGTKVTEARRPFLDETACCLWHVLCALHSMPLLC
jgi:hypothetical protein